MTLKITYKKLFSQIVNEIWTEEEILYLTAYKTYIFQKYVSENHCVLWRKGQFGLLVSGVQVL